MTGTSSIGQLVSEKLLLNSIMKLWTCWKNTWRTKTEKPDWNSLICKYVLQLETCCLLERLTYTLNSKSYQIYVFNWAIFVNLNVKRIFKNLWGSQEYMSLKLQKTLWQVFRLLALIIRDKTWILQILKKKETLWISILLVIYILYKCCINII